MKSVGAFISLLMMYFLVPAWAHEGHDSPGALPPPPNGGAIAEASHEGAHEEEGERELFLEARLEGTKLSVYALGLGPKNTKVWQALKPSPQLSIVSATLELPRAKKTLPLTLKPTEKGWEGDLGPVKGYRFIVWVTFLDGGEKKQAKVQLER